MIYGDVCSGISAPTAAWRPLGWRCAFYSEIEPFPRAVLEHHYPETPLHGDFTTIEQGQYETIDVLVGGTPCQDFSVAGLRAGMAGDRGNLTLQFLTLAGRLRPRWVVWENVPGVLSSNGGRDFGAFLGGLGELGYGWAYRTLDAQYFGVPQRRRRVFVVGHLGDWRRAAAVLFERHCLQGHPAPRRETREDAATSVIKGAAIGSRAHGARSGSAKENTLIANAVTSKWHKGTGGPAGDECQNLISHALRADGFDAGEDGTGRGTPLTLAIRGRGDSHDLEWRDDGTANAILTPNGGRAGIGVGAIGFYPTEGRDPTGYDQLSPAVKVGSGGTSGNPPAVAFAQNQRGEVLTKDVADSLKVGGGKPGQGYPAAMQGMAVRRLTPRECERLQGFPDDFTLVPYRGKPAADGPRYKALGNSMAVPVLRWIGERIEMVTAL